MNGEKEKEKEEGRKASRATSNPNNHLFAVAHTPSSKRCVGGMVVLCRVDEKPLEQRQVVFPSHPNC